MTGRDDVAERDQLTDLAIECDAQHAVVVSIGDQEPATVGFQRVLDSCRHEEVGRWRIGQGEGADVGDDREAVGTVDPVDADDVAATDVRTDQRDEDVRRRADERDVHGSTDTDDEGRQTGGERCHRSGLGIHARHPAYSAFGHEQCSTGADGPARPARQARDENVAVGAGGWPLAANGVVAAIRAAAPRKVSVLIGLMSRLLCVHLVWGRTLDAVADYARWESKANAGYRRPSISRRAAGGTCSWTKSPDLSPAVQARLLPVAQDVVVRRGITCATVVFFSNLDAAARAASCCSAAGSSGSWRD